MLIQILQFLFVAVLLVMFFKWMYITIYKAVYDASIDMARQVVGAINTGIKEQNNLNKENK